MGVRKPVFVFIAVSLVALVLLGINQGISLAANANPDPFSGVGGAVLPAPPAAPLAATAPDLGAAGSFAVLAASAVTNTGPSFIGGDLGISPNNASSITGFAAGLVKGTIHAADGVALQAQNDVITAYNALASQPCDSTFKDPTDLGGMTLKPGVYCFGSSAGLTGELTLNGLPTDVWVFKIGSAITTAPGSSIVFTGGGQSCNVFWQVTSSATLDTTTHFVGNILALVSVTINTNARLEGRALARTGAVTLDSNNVTFSTCSLQQGTATSTPLASTQTAFPLTATALVKTSTPTATQTATATKTATARPAATSTSTAIPLKLPGTGFAPGVNTILANQPADKTYASLGELWLEIPGLGVQSSIVGVPQTNGNWDVSWLKNNLGWLSGTAFPTWAGNSVLTGHVYDANGNAGPFVQLHGLGYADRIIIHAWGQQYIYEVRSVDKVTPSSVSSVTKHETLPWLTLITCSGYDETTQTYKYRVIVRAVQVQIQ